MKIRNGFVSNSSSSSFCIYGVCLHNILDIDLIKCFDFDEEDVLYGYEGFEIRDKLICYLDLAVFEEENSWSELEDCHDVYLGLPPEKMEKEETLAQFENRVRDLILNNYPKAKCLIDNKELKFHYGEVTNE